jgi:hypothetical protein
MNLPRISLSLSLGIFISTFFIVVGQQSLDAQQETNLERLEREAQEAGQRAADETIDPNEIDMIKYRRILMGQPGLQLYVVLMSRSGQPVHYFVTEGKCVSSRKRLTPTHQLIDTGPNSLLVTAPSEDGTHGSSAPYIYCKTVDGKYIQWNGQYYASNSPIELTIKPLVIDVSGRIQSQQ